MSFTESRLELIRAMLRQKQRVHVKDLVDQLKVSHESIRRDLRELETQGFAGVSMAALCSRARKAISLLRNVCASAAARRCGSEKRLARWSRTA